MAIFDYPLVDEKYICFYSGREDSCPIYKMKLYCELCIDIGADENLADTEQKYEQTRASWHRFLRRLMEEPELIDDYSEVIRFIDMVLSEDESIPAFHVIALNMLSLLTNDPEGEENLEQSELPN